MLEKGPGTNRANKTVKARLWPWLSDKSPGRSPGARAGSLRLTPSRTAPALLSAFGLQGRGFGFDAQRPTYTLPPTPLTLHPTHTVHPNSLPRYTLHPATYTLHLSLYTPNTLYTLTPYHPTPYSKHPTPYNLHPTLYTVHLTPYSLLHTPYNIQPPPCTPHTSHPTPCSVGHRLELALLSAFRFGLSGCGPSLRQPGGKLMVSLINSHANATKIGWHLWEIDSRCAPGLPPGWLRVWDLGCRLQGSGCGVQV